MPGANRARTNFAISLDPSIVDGHGFGGQWIQIEPDGRFAWCVSACGSHGHEYGYLKRHGEEVELVSISHPGIEIDPLRTYRFRSIEWGNRLYLSRADDQSLQEFCRASLTPSRSSKSDEVYRSYLRTSVTDKPRQGLPRLPAKVWLKFLIGEMNGHLSVAHHEPQDDPLTQ